MIPHNRLPSSSAAAFAHPSAAAAPSSTAQAAPQNPQALTSLSGQFMLEFGGAPGQAPVERFIVPPRSRTEPATMPDQEVINLLSSISRLADAWQLTSQHHAQGGRTLTFTRPNRENDPREPVVTLSIGRDNALRVFQVDTVGRVDNCWFAPKILPQPLARRPSLGLLPHAPHGDNAAAGKKHRLTPPSPPPARAPQPDATAGPSSATATWTHAGLRQQAQDNQASTVINRYLEHFQMNWHALSPEQQRAVWNAASHVPQDAPHPEAARQHQVQAALLRIQVPQRMAWLSSLRQDEPLVIDTAHLAQDNQVATAYAGATVDGPHVDEFGDPHFYLEIQPPGIWSCAAHASRAMVGAPWLSMTEFARHEAAVDISRSVPGPGPRPEPTPEHIQATEDLQGMQGVHPETVQAVLERMGMPTHSFTSVAISDADGTLRTDQAQFDFLDTLNTDRLLLQSEITLDDNTGASHWVALRRDGEQWVLLDSLAGVPQHGVQPSQYLRSQGATHFNAIWPQHRLVAHPAAHGAEAASEAGSERSFDAHDNRTGAHRSDLEAGPSNRIGSQTRQDEFAPLILDWSAVPNQANMRGKPKSSQTKSSSGRTYAFRTATSHWTKSKQRQQEFAPLLEAWNAATNSNKHAGPNLLQRLAKLGSQEAAQGRGTVVEDSDGRVRQVRVQLAKGVPSVDIWLGTYPSGLPNVRLAPPPGDNAARKVLLEAMFSRKKVPVNVKVIQTGSALTASYSAKQSAVHWTSRANEFGDLLARWSATTLSLQPYSGPAMLRRLAELCTEEFTQGRATVVAGSDGEVHEASVRLQEGMPEERIWFSSLPSGLLNLHLAPPADDVDARTALLKAMRRLFKGSQLFQK
ncbi:hypothetical protein RY831_27480 [Noviherbaspirillum sp. CPCC 100848]|uniref:Uncharacterized protein n=1 Tax=Noviherbaspirillum album TaxID=3080276 RepID=A0ABU6JHZ0_9BURK|nr:hypothetical protein [Noviherbaspirillum sp. CPCC 100848]MEC4722905.1 hypothetical protein [Noviherbaspirillum sp. CPCC 100848]